MTVVYICSNCFVSVELLARQLRQLVFTHYVQTSGIFLQGFWGEEFDYATCSSGMFKRST